MAGPFPGMDPYIEAQGAWPDFHNGLIAEIRNDLGARLPDSYVARVDDYTIVARGTRLPLAELYRWTVRDPLPRVPIPLREPDADILIDLAGLVNRVYDMGRYARTLRHQTQLPETMSLTTDDRAWVESLTRPASAATFSTLESSALDAPGARAGWRRLGRRRRWRPGSEGACA
jgi:hypothetical protein